MKMLYFGDPKPILEQCLWGVGVKWGGQSTPNSGANCMANSGANSTPNCMANSRAIPRLIAEAKSRKLLEIVEDDKKLRSVFWVRLYQKVWFLIGKWTILGA